MTGCFGPRPSVNCPYYVSWEAYVTFGDDWVDEGGYSIAGTVGRYLLGEAYIYPDVMVAQGYKGYNYDYYKYVDAIKLNLQSGGGYTLYGLGGEWGDRAGNPVGKKQVRPDEFPFFYIWSPKEGKISTELKVNFGGKPERWTPETRNYYSTFAARCGRIPEFTIVSCSPPKYFGAAAPPPPPPRDKMNCCDCNTIATIFEDKITNSLKPIVENLKDHIDQRSQELTVIHKKQLQVMELDLNPLMERLNEVERNLWNGILK